MKWLFLVHQVQTPNSRERVKVWRLIKKTGAVLHRNSVYVLPYHKERLEDFQWVAQQIRDSKGEASVYVSQSPDKDEDRRLRALFDTARTKDYSELLSSVQGVLNRVLSAKKEKRMTQPLIRRFNKEEADLLEVLEDIKRVDFFSSRVSATLKRIFKDLRQHLLTSETVAPAFPQRCDRKDFQNKLWTTREHIHIDRLCSAWLILRFIDRRAKFAFASENALPKEAIAFDVLGAQFSHHGEDCTFETLTKSFQIQDPAVRIIGEIIHDVDLKDHKFGRPEGPGLDALIRALSFSAENDFAVLKHGIYLLDMMYQYYSGKSIGRK